MKNYNYLTGALVIAVFAVLGLFFARTSSIPSNHLVGSAVLPNYTTTNGSSTCGAAIGTLMSANSAIQFRSISVSSATGPVYLWLNATSTSFSAPSGITVFPSSTYSMSDVQGNLWTGNIYCIGPVTSSTVTYTQW